MFKVSHQFHHPRAFFNIISVINQSLQVFANSGEVECLYCANRVAFQEQLIAPSAGHSCQCLSRRNALSFNPCHGPLLWDPEL